MTGKKSNNDMQDVIIIGAGGHGHVDKDIIEACGDKVLGFLDDNQSDEIIGKVSDHTKYPDCAFVIAIGNPQKRDELSALPLKWYTAVHPTAVVSKSASIGAGTVVMPKAVINARAKIGDHCIINTGAIVEHDNELSDFVHISVGAKLGGTVRVGKHSWVGIGATVSNNITICEDCMIGAGSLVVKDITEPGTYYGTPVRKAK